jgi:ureidoacrylate peracid hydrolase
MSNCGWKISRNCSVDADGKKKGENDMHKVSLPQASIDHVMRRRGRLHAYDSLDPARTALLVIDMQNFWCLDGMPAYSPTTAALAPNVNRLAEAMRDAGSSVWWIRAIYEGAAKDWSSYMGYLNPDDVAMVMAHLSEGHEASAVWGGMDVRDGDEHVVKTRFSAFIRGASDIEERLRARGIDRLVLVGVATDVCVESTARDAFMLDFENIVVSDGTATRSDEAHNASLGAMFTHFADIMTTDEVIGLLKPSGKAAAAE